MDMLKGIIEQLRLDFDRNLLDNEHYANAEDTLHEFIENELSPEIAHKIEPLINDVTNAMFHAAIEDGIKYGAKLTAELLE